MQPITIMKAILANLLLLVLYTEAGAQVNQYVDPKIGTEGLGRTFIGPSCPFGMAKPGPDCTNQQNSGWLPMPAQLNGFSQTHVSGTGGGPKYGNVLVMPVNVTEGFAFSQPEDENEAFWVDQRKYENVALAYYETELESSGIKIEVTTSERASMYRILYPDSGVHGLVIDAGFFLGEQPEPNAREAQQFEGSAIWLEGDNAIAGSTTISGGWNNGAPYSVHFYAQINQPVTELFRWGADTEASAANNNIKSGIVVGIDNAEALLRVGISFLSVEQARANMEKIAHKSFDQVRADAVAQWEDLLSRLTIDEGSSEVQKRMYYTALYHTMIMPVDRTGENPKWNSDEPYYDDYYAIWDTYRTSMPLITLIDEQRQADMVRSLIDIAEHEGYMPDARSGNSNGRTQGGSNGEVAVADAWVKGLKDIDYEKALAAMIRDAEVAPEDDEAEGRGGLEEYNSLGYIPYGIDRAGNRTVEYSLCDHAIATVAKGLNHPDIAEKYAKRANNWKNLWRDDYEHFGIRGFIMPRDSLGRWLDEIPYGQGHGQLDTFQYRPDIIEGPWHVKWWGTFFYEGTSWEYSLSMPHDVPGLITKCGGRKEFEKRLDSFFDHGFYNVNNEPSFLTPCLYHWIGRPDRTSDRVHETLQRSYNDSANGLPGNDDSGAMSSWLAFHMIGFYPNAGHDYYLIHTPEVKSTKLLTSVGTTFEISAPELSEDSRYIVSAALNGKDYPWSAIRHADILAGGKLELKMASEPGAWGKLMLLGDSAIKADTLIEGRFTFKLYGQTRRFDATITDEGGDLRIAMEIMRNGALQKSSVLIPAEARRHGVRLTYPMPENGKVKVTPDDATFLILSEDMLREARSTGVCNIDESEFQVIEINDKSIELNNGDCVIKVLNFDTLPLIIQMHNNPLNINWTFDSESI